jgi:uncharacterized membrane protein
MKKKNNSKKKDALFNKWSKKIKNRLTRSDHLNIIGLGFLISTSLYLLTLKFFKFTFTPSQTTAINWLTVNKYPKQQDYYIFISYVGFTYLCTLLIWYLWINSKIKK